MVNREWERLTGWSNEELSGRDILAELYTDPEHRRYVLDFINSSTGEWRDFKTRVRSGKVLETSWANVKLMDGMSIGIGQDVTERKVAEKAREQLLKDRKQLLRRLVTAQEEERRRIARELHDQLGQQITALMLGLKWLKDSGHCQPPAAEHLGRLQEYADQLGREVHNIAWELRPTALDDLGLHTALGNYLEKWAEGSGKVVELHSHGFNGHRLSTQIETTLYRVIQEALTNVLKHAEAEFVSLILERRGNHVLAIIEDDGRGFNVEAVMSAPESERKLGLLGMRERLALVFGTLDIESTPGAGTTVFVRIPTPPLESERAAR
jgi:PAS domain S-box-containing protein